MQQHPGLGQRGHEVVQVPDQSDVISWGQRPESRGARPSVDGEYILQQCHLLADQQKKTHFKLFWEDMIHVSGCTLLPDI